MPGSELQLRYSGTRVGFAYSPRIAVDMPSRTGVRFYAPTFAYSPRIAVDMPSKMYGRYLRNRRRGWKKVPSGSDVPGTATR